ncbi:hypothetical protein KAI37_02748 [Paenibacillus sp. S25]|nr:hypothetical protein KAI37_02748 [Paenibacillus sp. S25]
MSILVFLSMERRSPGGKDSLNGIGLGSCFGWGRGVGEGL